MQKETLKTIEDVSEDVIIYNSVKILHNYQIIHLFGMDVPLSHDVKFQEIYVEIDNSKTLYILNNSAIKVIV